MKIIPLLLLCVVVISCGKEISTITPEELKSTIVSANLTHVELMASWVKRVKDEEYFADKKVYTDAKIPATYIKNNEVWVGNSIVYNAKFDTAHLALINRGHNLINRGIPASRHQDLQPYIYDLVTKHAPKTIIIGQGENELSWEVNKATKFGTKLDSAYNSRFVLFANEVLRQNDTAHIIILSIKRSPAYVNAGLSTEIAEMNAHQQAWVAAKKALGKKVSYVQLPTSLDNPSVYAANEGANGIHFASPGKGYSIYLRAIEPYLNLKFSSPAPIPVNNYPQVSGPLTARAGADQTNPISWNYCRLNASGSTIGSGGWISTFQWTQVSGPSTVTYQNRNAGNTLIYGMKAGIYKFRVKVTGMVKTNNTYQTYTAYDEVQVTFTP